MGDRPKGTTIYVDQETATLARDLSKASGQPVSHLFKRFLSLHQNGVTNLEPIATVLSSNVKGTGGRMWANETISPSSKIGTEISADRYQFEKWIDMAKTDSILLMGMTMNRGIANHLPLWESFLKQGKNLRVLLQGNLDNGQVTLPISCRVDELKVRRDYTIELLTRITNTTPSPKLEVRISQHAIFCYSAVLVFLSDGIVNIQLQPYMHFFGIQEKQGPRFVLSSKVGENIAHEMIDPIEELWNQSKVLLKT